MIVYSDYKFDIAHSLPEGILCPGHKCTSLHGHTYHMSVGVRGWMNRRTFMVMEYGEMDRLIKSRVVDVVDHKNLNDFVSPSTCENFALWVWSQLDRAISEASEGRVVLEELILRETDGRKVIYRGEEHGRNV